MSGECLVQFEKANSMALAGKLIGRKVRSGRKGKEKNTGKTASLHGKNGMVRVRFKRGVPGQALGAIVELTS